MKGKSGGRRPAPNRAAPATVDDYFALLPQPTRRRLRELRAAIRSTLPRDATETISYQMPAFRQDRVLVWYGAFTNHVSLFPGGRVLEELKDDVADYATRKGTIQFPLDQPLPIRLIKRIVNARIAELSAKKGR